MPVTVTGQMPNFQYAVAAEAHSFAADKRKRHLLRLRRAILYFSLSL
jgi:hypothetical protein